MPYLERFYLAPPRLRPGTLNAYLLAASLVALAVALRLAIGSAVPGLQFITLFPAILLTAMICGVNAGIFAVIASTLSAWYFFLAPAFSFRIGSDSEFLVLAIFSATATFIVLVVGAMRTAIERARDLSQTLTVIFEASPDAILLTNRRGAITNVNRRATELFARSRESLVGAPLHSLLPEAHRGRHGPLHAEYMANPQPREMGSGLDLLALRGDGTQIEVDIRIGPIRIDHQLQAIATVRDMTEQRAAQRALAESRERQAAIDARQASDRALHSALERTTDNVVVLDREWRLIYMNQHARNRAGPERAVLGRVIWDIVPWLYDGAAGLSWRAAMESGVPVHIPASLTQEQTYVEANAYPSLEGLTIFYRDVTEAHRTAAALAQSEALLRLFIDRAPAAIAMFDTQMRYLAVSHRFTVLHPDRCASPEDLIGRTQYEVFPDIPRHWHDVHQRVLKGETLSSDTEPVPRKDGGTRWINWEMTPWHNADNAIGGALLFVEDVTRHRETEQALRQLTDDLTDRLRENEALVASLRSESAAREAAQARALNAERVQALGALTGGMAHDFNNLLGVIVLNLDVTQRMLPEHDPKKKLVVDALGSARSGAALIRSLLAFARRQPLAPARTVLNEQVCSMYNLLVRTLGENITITFECAPDLWPVMVDPSQVEACLLNLATNARDAMPAGGALTITTNNLSVAADDLNRDPSTPPGDYAVLAVSDTGNGMTPGVMARAFEPFFSTKGEDRGTGLGLAMVYGFAQQSGGHVSVDSTPGKGATIRVFLPRAPEVATSPAPPQPPDPLFPMQGHGETVLVVEDDPNLRDAVVQQLNTLRYRAIEAASPAAALRLLASERIDLVFSDVVMPGGMDGFELAEQVDANWPSVGVLLTSGFSNRPLGAGSDGTAEPRPILAKPYDQAQLARAIRQALDRHPAQP